MIQRKNLNEKLLGLYKKLMFFIVFGFLVSCAKNTTDRHLQGREIPRVITKVTEKPQAYFRVNPRYPLKAVKQRIEGYVKINFTVNEKGLPININIVKSRPKGVFERVAVDALKHWRFQRLEVNGVPQVQKKGTEVFKFKFSK
ncbi:MAG: energy transducer TonB [Methylococcales bacterium]|nr:energy transducer TonB [Methylococcales bacterium]